MASTLQDLLDASAAPRLAGWLQQASPDFDARRFLAQISPGYDALGLMARGQRMADALAACLPSDFAQAAAILLKAMGPPLPLDAKGEPVSDGRPYSGFLYLPYSLYIARHGLAHFEPAMALQHALTQRFTAEFCIRPFIELQAQATLARLLSWTQDPSAHVRRLVSEGTRPRLPWAARLPALMADPAPVLPLLECLRDDPSSYVRRSVANHLNDIGKDHPGLLVQVAERWLRQAPPERQRLVRHALRSAVKRGDLQALAVLGLGHKSGLVVRRFGMAPSQPRIGEALELHIDLHNPGPAAERAVVDLQVHYIKAKGEPRPKVFKLQTVDLAPGETLRISKHLSLAQMTTRTHYPGRHTLALLLNGRTLPLGHFDLLA